MRFLQSVGNYTLIGFPNTQQMLNMSGVQSTNPLKMQRPVQHEVQSMQCLTKFWVQNMNMRYVLISVSWYVSYICLLYFMTLGQPDLSVVLHGWEGELSLNWPLSKVRAGKQLQQQTTP